MRISSALKQFTLDIEKIIPYANNSRTHSADQIAKIASSINEFGFNDPIAIDTDNGIIAGHGRLEAAKLLGLTEVPVIQIGHLTRAQKKAYVLAHNKIAIEAGWDKDLLRIELEELKDAGFNVALTGFDTKEIEAYLNPEVINEGLVDENSIPTLNHDSLVSRGDTWLLGNHRLRCGDSTNPLDVQELCKEFKPNLMVTDPPYGVNYAPEWREDAGKRVGEKSLGKVENDHEMDWTDAYSLFTGNIGYVWHAGLYSADICTHLRNCGFEVISQIIWVKQHFAISRGDYHWQHEPCWYVVRKGKNHHWQGARDQSSTWNILSNIAIGNPNPEKTHGHATQKPIECMAKPILNNSLPNDYVYDPFGGSGTTLIAAEKHNRNCLMMEISPLYVEVIIKRWQDFSGRNATLESTGATFEEIVNARSRRSAA